MVTNVFLLDVSGLIELSLMVEQFSGVEKSSEAVVGYFILNANLEEFPLNLAHDLPKSSEHTFTQVRLYSITFPHLRSVNLRLPDSTAR